MTVVIVPFPAREFDDPNVWLVADGTWVNSGPLSQFILVGDDASVMAVVAPEDARCIWTALPDLEPKQAEGVARIRATENSLGTVHAVARHLENEVVVAATIAPAAMEQGLARLMLRGLNPDIVIPLGLVIDTSSNRIAKAEFEGLAALRGPDFAVPDEPVFRDLVVSDQPVEPVSEADMRSMLLAASSAPVLNLREGLFAKREPREWGTANQRRWVIRLIGGLVVTSLLLATVVWARHKGATASENERAIAAAQKIDPSIQDIAQAESALDRALAQKGMAKGRFVPLSAGLWRSVKASPNVSARELRYGADGILTVVLAAPDANSVNKALVAIQQDGFRVTATPRQDSSGATLVDLTMRMP